MGIITGGKVIEGALKRQPAFSGAGAPVANVTGLGSAVQGDQYLNTTDGDVYVVTATNGTSTITWAVMGTQA